MNQESKPPLFKRLMDNPWLLLALGLIIPLLSYTRPIHEAEEKEGLAAERERTAYR
ncbi:MAG: hypothetical protein IAE94_16015, partial [Chthoniobacterales bacterium]|nr:hypothetical protein [Chthoniobacterales bacterium]